MNINDLQRRVLAGKRLDPDAVAFLNATAISDITITNAINNLVLDLKSNSLWSKLNVIYPFVGGTAFTHKFNLKDPRDLDVAFRAEMIGTITHNSLGVRGNGIDSYIKTKIFLNTNVNTSNNSFFVYSNENIISPNTTGDLGYRVDSANFTGLLVSCRVSANAFSSRNFQTSGANNISNSNSIGFFGISRTNDSEYSSFLDGTVFNHIVGIGSFPSHEVYTLGRNIGGTSFDSIARNQSFFCFGEGLNNTEMSNLRTIVLGYQTILGRA